MKVHLEQNSNAGNAPYVAVVEITKATIDINTRFRVPITEQINGKSKYTANVCGFAVEGDGPDVVAGLLEKLMPHLVNMARLPNYVFIARRSQKMYPVYTYGDKVFATTPGGPIFEHVELAKVREYLSEYLHSIGQFGVPGKSEHLHVRGVHWETLALMRPIFYLKKRPEAHDDNEFWAPVFTSRDGLSIYAYAASGRREVDVDNGYEIFYLRQQVARALIADKRLKEDYDLRIDRLLPEYWAQVAQGLVPINNKLAFNDTSFDVFRKGRYMVAVERRQPEERYSFYIGQDLDDLQLRAGRDLIRRGVVKKVDDVKIV
jgi:hypothetical protein